MSRVLRIWIRLLRSVSMGRRRTGAGFYGAEVSVSKKFVLLLNHAGLANLTRMRYTLLR